jgi:hypothetical protein
MNPIFSPGTLKAILNSAPVIIQGAGKLIQLIRERDKAAKLEEAELPMTLEGLKSGIEQLDQRLDENEKSDVEQIRLIEQLARQNEMLADSLNRTYRRLNIVTGISIIALIAGCIGLLLTLA